MLSVVEQKLPDYLIHLGDGEQDLYQLEARWPLLPIIHVQGNCDRFSTAEYVFCEEIAGKRIFATHGHRFNVKFDSTLQSLRYAAMERNAEILLYGHTHEPFQDFYMGMHILNPGSAGASYCPTYGEIHIDKETVSVEILPI